MAPNRGTIYCWKLNDNNSKMPGTPCKNRKKDPVELVRATARRLSADLRDVQGFIGRECRDAGRELREFQQEMTTRLRRSSLQGLPSLPRIDLPRIGISFADGPRYSSVEDVKLPSCQDDMESLLDDDDDEESAWCRSPRPVLTCDDDDEFDGRAIGVSPARYSPALTRSPRSEELLRNMGDTMRKCSKFLGLESTLNGPSAVAGAGAGAGGAATPRRNCQRQLQQRISAPPPSPSNFGVSAVTK